MNSNQVNGDQLAKIVAEVNGYIGQEQMEVVVASRDDGMIRLVLRYPGNATSRALRTAEIALRARLASSGEAPAPAIVIEREVKPGPSG